MQSVLNNRQSSSRIITRYIFGRSLQICSRRCTPCSSPRYSPKIAGHSDPAQSDGSHTLQSGNMALGTGSQGSRQLPKTKFPDLAPAHHTMHDPRGVAFEYGRERSALFVVRLANHFPGLGCGPMRRNLRGQKTWGGASAAPKAGHSRQRIGWRAKDTARLNQAND